MRCAFEYELISQNVLQSSDQGSEKRGGQIRIPSPQNRGNPGCLVYQGLVLFPLLTTGELSCKIPLQTLGYNSMKTDPRLL